MNRSLFILSTIFVITLLLHGSVSKYRERFQVSNRAPNTEIGSLMSRMSNLDAQERTLKDRRYQSRLLTRGKRSELKNIKGALKDQYEKIVCDGVPQFEDVDLDDFSNATNESGVLSFNKTYHKGVWNEENSRCVHPFSRDRPDVVCSDYSVKCAKEGTDKLTHRVGKDRGDVCEFDRCPIYCKHYNLECYQLLNRNGEHFFVPVDAVRSNCLDPLDNNHEHCVEPIPENCPKRQLYFYDDDNLTIRSNEYTPNVHDQGKCVYTHNIIDRPVFDSYDAAASNCSDRRANKKCYSPNGRNHFLETSHRLNRFDCSYYDEPVVCNQLSEISCPESSLYYSIKDSLFDSEDGIFYRNYESKTVPQTLSKDSSGYACVHSRPSDSMLETELQESCSTNCFPGDGSEPAILKSGTLNSDNSKCVVLDCYESSQKKTTEDCEDVLYYHYAEDNITLVAGNKTKQVVNNVCTYDVPSNVPNPVFSTETEAYANCPNMEPEKICYYTASNGDVRSERHSLNRISCSYDGERPGCSDRLDTDLSCPGTTTYYKIDSPVSYNGGGEASREVLSEEVPNRLKPNSPDHFVCSPGPSSPGYLSNPQEQCQIDCFSPTSGAARVKVQGAVNEDRCLVSHHCYDTERLLECSENSTYYKLGEGEFDIYGNFVYPLEKEIKSHTLLNNSCHPTPSSAGYGSLPTSCSKECYPDDGGVKRILTAPVEGPRCVLSNCYPHNTDVRCSSNAIVYKDNNDGAYQPNDTYTFTQERMVVPYIPEGDRCILDLPDDDSYYQNTSLACEAQCYEGTNLVTKQGTWDASESICRVRECKACGAENNLETVRKYTLTDYYRDRGEAVFDVETRKVNTALKDKVCEPVELPDGFTLSNACSYENCYRTEGDPTSRFTATGTIRAQNPTRCVVSDCFPSYRGLRYE